MIKSIIKEIFIMLLLCLAIVLVLGVIFYDYIPTNKTVPNKLATYTTPEEVKEEIDQKVAEIENEVITYTITGADLNLYKQTNSYETGKADPFSASTYVDNSQTGDTNTSEPGSSSGEGTEGSTNQNIDSGSSNTFFEDTGLK